MLRNTVKINKSISSFSFYEVLGVKETSSFQEIRQNYLLKIKAAHPDIDEGSHKKFISVRKAFETLSNPVSRKKYDCLMGIGSPQWTMQGAKSALKETDFDHFLPGKCQQKASLDIPNAKVREEYYKYQQKKYFLGTLLFPIGALAFCYLCFDNHPIFNLSLIKEKK